jgi:hypothetical protein
VRRTCFFFAVLQLIPRAVAAQGDPVGPEFRVNMFTTGIQRYPSVATGATGGNFVVVWASGGQDGSGFGIFGQRYASTGAPLGPEFRVNTYTTAGQRHPAVASSFAGNFAVVWESDQQDGSGYGIFGQRYTQIVPVELTGIKVE